MSKTPRVQSPTIAFSRRAKLERTDVAVRRIFTSDCGWYRVVECRWNVPGLPNRWEACALTYVSGRATWALLGTSRTRSGAELGVRDHARRTEAAHV